MKNIIKNHCIIKVIIGKLVTEERGMYENN